MPVLNSHKENLIFFYGYTHTTKVTVSININNKLNNNNRTQAKPLKLESIPVVNYARALNLELIRNVKYK